MIKVLFICHGNICRSPMAEYILKNMTAALGVQNSYRIDSAATSREEIGNDIYPPAKKCLADHGIYYERHSARQMTKSDLDYYDYIIAMEDYNIRNLQRMFGDSEKYSLLLDYTNTPGNISDPWYSGDFETAYKEIETGCRGFLNKMER